MIEICQFLFDSLLLFASVNNITAGGIAEFQEISIDEIPSYSIRYMHILPSIVIKICNQNTPAPVGSRYPCQLHYFTKKRNRSISSFPVSIIQLQHVSHELGLISSKPFCLVTLIIHEGIRS